MIPGVSVIVPVYGPGPHLRTVVTALERQSVTVAQIIISHSGPGNPALLFGDKPGVTLLHSDQRLLAGAARNRGVALTKTPWVAFIDEDVVVSNTWHEVLLNTIADKSVDCILGPLGNGGFGGYWGTCTWLTEFSSVHPHAQSRYVDGGASANMAIDRERFFAAGEFPEHWQPGEETVLQLRLRKSGGRIWFEKGLRAEHINVPGLPHMMRHQYRAGCFSARVRRVHPELLASVAARIPLLSLGLWLARLWLTFDRAARGSNFMRAVIHLPGILIGLLAWNIGFTREALRRAQSRSEP